MPVTQLETKRVEKPWGRHTLWPGFPDAPEGGTPIGEVWFEHPDPDAALLIKYLFTSRPLSIQDHPDDEYARAHGEKRGKSECWVVLDAEPHATIGLGLREAVSKDALRDAAQDGSIEQLMDWKSVKAGDFLYSPAGTVHAIGGGVTVIETQQNSDTTYRLYDYGSGRELHLDDGIAVADPVPYVAPFIPKEAEKGRLILSDGPIFTLERWTREGSGRLSPASGRPMWLVPIAGKGTIDGQPLEPGTCWAADEAFDLTLDAGADLLVAYPGGGVLNHPWSA